MEDVLPSRFLNAAIPEIEVRREARANGLDGRIDELGRREGFHDAFVILWLVAKLAGFGERRDESQVPGFVPIRKIAPHHQNLFRMTGCEFRARRNDPPRAGKHCK